MLRNRLLFLLLPIGALGCDNVGRAFDREVNPNDPTSDTGTSSVQVVPEGGNVRDGRPQVRAAYPEGAGWPGTVPIVVEFSESVNEDSLLPTTATGIDGRIGVRVLGSPQLLPCQYNLVAEGRLLIMRPLNGLPNNGDPIYEVVLFPEGRDVDGVRFQVSGGETVLTDFQVNQDESITDGRILAQFPRDNNDELQREGDVYVFFDRPANVGTITDSNIFVQPQGGSAIPVALDPQVLTTVGVPDVRAVRIEPASELSPSTTYELTVTQNITFGQDGSLDFNGATPFSEFRTVAVAAPTLVELGNPLTGFPNKINRQNALSAVLHVTTPADTLVGDLVRARVYGSDAQTTQTFDLGFAEQTATAMTGGVQTVLVDFSTLLGTLNDPFFDDGDITFAAQMERGGGSSGFLQNDGNADPIFDITSPTLQQAGPPGSTSGLDIFTDQEYLTFYGIASEAIGAASLVDGINPAVELFASDDGGRFLMRPLTLGRLTGPRGYSLTLTDRSGNLAAGAVNGNIIQHGQVTGVLAGTLTVEAYDEATLLPIPDATVLIDAGAPTLPAVGQLVGTTDASGRAVFTVGAGAQTVTIIRAGYDLITLYESQAAMVSLPLRPTADAEATATLQGTLAFPPTPGTTAIVGNTAIADNSVLGIRTTNATPNSIPDTAILPNRPQVTTGFAGSFEPTATPAFVSQGCEICGPTLLVPTAPTPPADPGSTIQANFALLDVGMTFGSLLGPHTENFGLATGLDTASLVSGQPRVRVTSSLLGFSGQALTGIGYVASNAGAMYDVDANFALPLLGGLALFAPVSWLLTEAEDLTGRLSRVRVLLNAGSGTIVPGTGPSPIPIVTVPTGPSTGSPAVMHTDVLNPVLIPGGIGFHEVTATDEAGRRWTVLVPDRDGAGATDTIQYPDLVTPNVAGLQAGNWDVQVEARLLLSITLATADDLLLTERIRQEVNCSRSRVVAFMIQ